MLMIGYARVSKADGTQLLDLQLDALLEAGVDTDRIYEDRASGRHDHRPGLDACLKALQPGNALVVWKLDRLGRSLKDLVTTVEKLQDRDVGLRVLAGAGAEIDTTTANGRLVFAIFAALAEFERELIAERTPRRPGSGARQGEIGRAAAQDGRGDAAPGDARHGGPYHHRAGPGEAPGHDHDNPVHVPERRRYGEGARPEAARRGSGHISQLPRRHGQARIARLRLW